MMGHKLSGSEQPYSQPEINMLREAYNKAYAHLAITEVAVQQSRVETLEAQVEKLLLNGKHKEEQIKTLQASQSQAKIEALTKQVEEQNKQIMELMRTVAKLAMKAKPISKEELEAEEMQAEN